MRLPRPEVFAFARTLHRVPDGGDLALEPSDRLVGRRGDDDLRVRAEIHELHPRRPLAEDLLAQPGVELHAAEAAELLLLGRNPARLVIGDHELAVGAVTPDALPADFSLHGPWIAVAAPGERITSLDSNGPGLINAEPDQQGALSPINGTSFAAPFVSGLAALIRSRDPSLNARQVMDLIKRSARTPGSGPNSATGWGVIDPTAALSYVLPPPNELPNVMAGKPIPGRPAVVDTGRHARLIIFAVAAGSLVLMGVALALSVARRRRTPDSEGLDDDADRVDLLR